MFKKKNVIKSKEIKKSKEIDLKYDKPKILLIDMPGKTAEVLVSKRSFEEIPERIHRLKPVPIGYG